MLELGGGEGGVRFLPVAWLPAGVLSEIDTALAQIAESMREAGCAPQLAGAALEQVRRDLGRHAGGPHEVCLVTKPAVFDMAAELSSAAATASRCGLAAAAFALAGIEGQLLELLVDAQPMASA